MANVISRIGATVGRIFAKKPGYSLTRGGRSNPVTPETKTEDAMMAGRKRLEVIATNRDDGRNSTFSPATSLQLRNNVVGTVGGRLTVVKADGSINADATNAFRKWAKHAEFTRGISLNELLGQMLHQLTHLGGDFIAVLDRGELTHADAPTNRIKIFEPDQIRNIEDGEFARSFGASYTQTDGIVRDRFGRICAAFVGQYIGEAREFRSGEYLTLRLENPGDFSSSNWIHVANCERPNTARGISPVTHLADAITDLEAIKASEIKSAKVNAALGLVFKETDPNAVADGPNPVANAMDDLPGEVSQSDDEAAQALADIEAENAALKSASLRLSEGETAVVKLRPNTDLASFDSKRPNVNAVEFYDRLNEACGTVLGLPQMYTNLKPQGSYSGSRAEMALARPTFLYWQKFLERNFLDWLAARVLDALGYADADEDGLKWTWPLMDEIDEGSHQTALQKMFANGEKNLVDIHGADTESFIERRKVETEMFHSRGLLAPWEVLVNGAQVSAPEEKESK